MFYCVSVKCTSYLTTRGTPHFVPVPNQNLDLRHMSWCFLCSISEDKRWLLVLLILVELIFLCPRDKESGGHINFPLSVRSSVRLSIRPSRYRYIICPAISSYSFRATALLFCMMFIHIMEVCMSTGFWFSSNIWKWQVLGLSHFF